MSRNNVASYKSSAMSTWNSTHLESSRGKKGQHDLPPSLTPPMWLITTTIQPPSLVVAVCTWLIRFGYSLLRYIRSLPEVLHHLSIIVTLLHDKLVKPWGPAHQHVLALISVLAKVNINESGLVKPPSLPRIANGNPILYCCGLQEVGPELYPDHFHTLMGGLVSSLDPSRPEDTSRCFETMGYLLKHLARRITTVRPHVPTTTSTTTSLYHISTLFLVS